MLHTVDTETILRRRVSTLEAELVESRTANRAAADRARDAREVIDDLQARLVAAETAHATTIARCHHLGDGLNAGTIFATIDALTNMAAQP